MDVGVMAMKRSEVVPALVIFFWTIFIGIWFHFKKPSTLTIYSTTLVFSLSFTYVWKRVQAPK